MIDIYKLNITIGDKVSVLYNPNNDETFNLALFEKSGFVQYFDYDCGCGQSYPNDPMIGVKFNTGETEEYWKEEIKKL